MRHFVVALMMLAHGGCSLTHREGAITYAKIPTNNGTHRLTLDISVPNGPGPFPAIVYIHGGGWALGDLSDYEDTIKQAASAGFVAVTINYRLTDEDDGHGKARFPWPAQIEDVRCALRWLAANATTYNVNVNRVATVGGSAGGHLAMMAAYAQKEPSFDPTYCAYPPSVQVKAAVSLYGADDLNAVYEMTEWWLKPYITRFLNLPDGAKVSDYPDVFANANPLSYVGTGPKLPAYIIQGTADTLVPALTQRAFVEAARAAGQDVTIEYVEGAPHGLGTVGAQRANETTLRWLLAHL
jgi:acetyl esterase/lipase